MNRKLLFAGGFFGLLSIILGAFAAHSLEKMIDANAMLTFKTGVRYQMYHAFLLLLLGSTSFISKKAKTLLFYFIVVGVTCFSGSIFVLATNTLTIFNFKTLAFITPIGGFLLVIGWVIMLASILKTKHD